MTAVPTGVVVLGATGSIGTQTIDVARRLGLSVVGLVARTPSPDLVRVAADFPGATVAVAGGTTEERRRFEETLGRRAEFGPEAVVALAGRPASIVVNGIVGAAGLRASIEALEAGNRLALANKETMVAAGALVTSAAVEGGGEIIPVDSEHSAIFQCLHAEDRAAVEKLVLTASGGPFRGRSRAEIEEATPSEALRHPTWEMGPRITVDSATLANKGLEVIEAHYLFGFPYDRIEVVVHPQSVIHSMVRLVDGSLLAHLGAADMRIPIAYALAYPDRESLDLSSFDPVGLTLTFEAPDTEAFPALALAYEAGKRGGTAPAVYNAADEVAVSAFLDGRLGFGGIPRVIEATLESAEVSDPASIDDVIEADRDARALAASLLAGAC